MTNLSQTQIFCTPPTSQPDGVDEHGNDRDDFPVVMVRVVIIRPRGKGSR